MSKLNTLYLKHSLQNIKTLDSLDEFCKSRRKICTDNRNDVCRQVLQISQYKSLDEPGTNFCEIYKELADLARNLPQEELSKRSYVEMTPGLYQACVERGSTRLHQFLFQNGYDIVKDAKKYKPKRLIDLKRSDDQDIPTRIIRSTGRNGK